MYKILPNIRNQNFKTQNTRNFTIHQLKNLKNELPHLLRHNRSTTILDFIENNPTCLQSYDSTKCKVKEVILEKYPTYCVMENCHICTYITEDITLPTKRGNQRNGTKKPKCPKHIYSDNCHCQLCDSKRISKKFSISLAIVRQRRDRFEPLNFTPTPRTNGTCPLECHCPIHQNRTARIRADNARLGLPFPTSMTTREIEYYDTVSLTIR
jgi:hypothetical protein